MSIIKLLKILGLLISGALFGYALNIYIILSNQKEEHVTVSGDRLNYLVNKDSKCHINIVPDKTKIISVITQKLSKNDIEFDFINDSCSFKYYVGYDSYFQGMGKVLYDKSGIVQKIKFYNNFDLSLTDNDKPSFTINYLYLGEGKVVLFDTLNNTFFVSDQLKGSE